jgi:DNA-binding NarL/FixJ family response regulator
MTVSRKAVRAAAGISPLIRVLVADDQQVIRDGLSMVLGLLPGIDVVGTAIDGDDAVRQALAVLPDVVLMDLVMPNCNGVEATRRLTQERSCIPVVVLTTYSDDDTVFAALRAGARGFLTKDAGAEEILRAVCTVSAGQAQLDPSVQRRLVEAFARGERVGIPAAAGGGEHAGRAPDGLTPREVEVLAEIAAGLSNGEIAAKFRLSDTTVKTHVNHLLAKTGVRDRAQLVAYAFRRGLAD